MGTVRLEQAPVPQLVNTFPAFYGTPKAHFRIHNRPPILPILNHINQVHVLSSHVFKSHFNIILPSTPRFSKCSLSFRFPHQNFVYYHIFLLPVPAACPSRLPPFGLITRTVLVTDKSIWSTPKIFKADSQWTVRAETCHIRSRCSRAGDGS